MVVGCVVVNWNNYEDTQRCLLSLLSSRTSLEKKVVLVDNFSDDGSRERLVDFLRELPEVHFVANERNLGYAGGVNTGIKALIQRYRCDYIFALNNDLTVPDFFFDTMVDVALKNGIDIASPVFLEYGSDKVKFEGVRSYFKPLLHHIQIKGNFGRREWWPAEVCMGGAMMFSRRFIEGELWLYEPFFLYCEEDEVSVRAKMKGYSVGICGKTFVRDKGKTSLKRGKQRKESVFYFTVRNRVVLSKLFRRYGFFSEADLLLFLLSFSAACFALSLSLRGTLGKAILSGLRDGLRTGIQYHFSFTGGI